MLLRGMEVRIKSGPHAGRIGMVVSYPWLGNLWHTWVSVNVPSEYSEEYKTTIIREWITVRSRDVEKWRASDGCHAKVLELEKLLNG